MEFPKLDECLLAWLGAGRWRVLGCRLQVFTLMHRELLRMAGSGLLTGQPMTLADLDVAVQIGRRSPRQAARWLARPKSRLRGRFRACWLVLAYAWRSRAQYEALRHWLESCENAPDMLESEAPAAGGGQIPLRRDAPALLELWSVLAAAGFDAEEVVTRWPAGLARWHFEVIRSREGGRKFETDRDRDLIDKARAMRQVTEPELPPVEEVREKMRSMMEGMRPPPSTVDEAV